MNVTFFSRVTNESKWLHLGNKRIVKIGLTKFKVA